MDVHVQEGVIKINNYAIRLLSDKERKLVMNSELAKKLMLNTYKNMNIKFGFKVCEVDLEINSELEHDDLYISSSVINDMGFKLSCTYNLTVKGNTINFGPFLGVYMGKTLKFLERRLRLLNGYTQRYQEIQGVIFAFALDGIDTANLTMEGYFYNPEFEVWEKTVMPYPSAIFKRSVLNLQWREYFTALYGTKIFNSNTFSKWEMYKRLEQFHDIKKYIPYTTILEQKSDVINLLNKYRNIYIKPISGLQGLGIYNVIKKQNKVELRTRHKGNNIVKRFNREEELLHYIEENIDLKKYIFQETINIKIDNKTIDFRLGMDKDQTGSWQNTLFVSRVSEEGSIISNRAGGGRVKKADDVLSDIYHMSDEKIIRYKKKIRKIAVEISRKLECTGLNLGKLAFDFAVDDKGNIYLIEVNNKYPDDTLANQLDINQHSDYIRMHNMLYTKKLAGYSKEDNINLFNFVKEEAFVNEKVRYRLYLSIPRRNWKKAKNKIQSIVKNYEIVGLLKSNAKIRKLELELQGYEKELGNFIQHLQKELKSLNLGAIGRHRLAIHKNAKDFKVLMSIQDSSTDIGKLKKEIKKLEREKEEALKMYQDLKKSRSWRMTALFRKLMGKLK